MDNYGDSVRVLALNDDNHYTTFYLDDDATGYDMRDFLKLLSKPYLENYHIRYVYLIDIPDNDIKAQETFDVVDCRAQYMPWRKPLTFFTMSMERTGKYYYELQCQCSLYQLHLSCNHLP